MKIAHKLKPKWAHGSLANCLGPLPTTGPCSANDGTGQNGPTGPWVNTPSQQKAPVAPMTARAKTGPRGPGANLDHDYGRARARGSGDYKVCQLASWSQLQVWGKLADSVMWLGQVKNQRLMAGSVMWLGLAKVEGLTTDPETPRRMVARGR